MKVFPYGGQNNLNKVRVRRDQISTVRPSTRASLKASESDIAVERIGASWHFWIEFKTFQ